MYKRQGLLDVSEKQDLMITCESGITIRMAVQAISELGRATQGVKLIRVDEGDAIAAITQLDEFEVEAEHDIDENGEQPNGETPAAPANDANEDSASPEAPVVE